jgi:hypothetical protein
MNLSNQNTASNYFYVRTLNLLCKKELLNLASQTSRKGLKLYEEGWTPEGTALKYKKILLEHIKNFGISKIVLYNTVPPREIRVNAFRKCFYVSDVTVWESKYSFKAEEVIRNEDGPEDERKEPGVLKAGTILVCY